MIVEVTQYYRPNGRQVVHELEVSETCEGQYQSILECNARLTAEQLMTGTVSQAIECEDFDYDIILTKGSDFAENARAMEELILRFNTDDCVKRQEIENGKGRVKSSQG